MAGSQHEPAPWEARKQPTRAIPPAPPPQPNPYQNPYPQQGAPQPYGGPGYGQNPMYAPQGYAQPYPQQGYAQPFGQQAYTQPFGMTQGMKPHRAPVVLVLAVLTWALGCPITGFIAFFMAKKDLEEMQLGLMDPSGQGLTTAAKWIGLITACAQLFFVGAYILFMVVVMAAQP